MMQWSRKKKLFGIPSPGLAAIVSFGEQAQFSSSFSEKLTPHQFIRCDQSVNQQRCWVRDFIGSANHSKALPLGEGDHASGG